jgi:hypothetical protein
MLQLARSGMAELKEKGDAPTPVTKEWAKGSVEWQREQAGEVVPHLPCEKIVPAVGGARDSDEEIRELFQATLTP